MPSAPERLFAACCRLCAALVAAMPAAVFAALVWAVVSTLFASHAATGAREVLSVAVATLAVCAVAAVVGGGIGIGAAFAAEELAPVPVRRTIEGAIGFLSAVPAVAFGWFAVTVIGPLAAADPLGAVTPYAAAALVLSVMTAPTTCALVARSLRDVPASVRQASAAVGASRLQTTALVVIPAFRRRIAAAALAAFARAIGEATAIQILFVALARQSSYAEMTAAAAAFTRLTGGASAFGETGAYAAAVVVLCVAAGCALVVGREFGDPQWA